MSTIEVVLRDNDERKCGLYAPDIVTALAIAAINVDSGSAELRQSGHDVIRLRKRGDGLASYWEINS